MAFSDAEAEASRRLIELALAEDFGGLGDLTSRPFFPPQARGRADFIARKPGVLAGLPAAILTAMAVSRDFQFTPRKSDGDSLQTGDVIAVIEGSHLAILGAERTMLNFMQRLSGVATLTRRYVDAVAGLPAKILDTRKTTPGWRLLEKYAVRQGGGTNHRIGLYDAVMVKDNHLIANAKTLRWSFADMVREFRKTAAAFIEIEIDSLSQFDEALAAGPDILLLDNMNASAIRDAVVRRDRAGSKVLLEASGGVNLDTVRGLAETGVDRISVGALTHSAPALDIALDYE